MASTVTGALNDHFQTSASLVASVPVQYFEEIPEGEGVAPPFAVYTNRETIPQYTAETAYLESVAIDIDVFHRSLDTLDSIMRTLVNLFDWAKPSMTGATILHCRRSAGPAMALEQMRDRQGHPMHRASVRYDVLVQRAHT